MNYGGGCGGFIATRDEENCDGIPIAVIWNNRTVIEGEWGFGDVAYERTSLQKEEGKEFVGTAAALWGITAGVYLALMGPQGMKDIGKTICKGSVCCPETFCNKRSKGTLVQSSVLQGVCG